jgi:hypothetical protein
VMIMGIEFKPQFIDQHPLQWRSHHVLPRSPEACSETDAASHPILMKLHKQAKQI